MVRGGTLAMSRATNGAALHGSHQQIRTVFNFNMFRKQRDTREADMEPGVEAMMGLARRQRMQARLPPPKQIAEAFRELFAAKKQSSRPITDTEAQLALQSLRYCQSALHDEEGKKSDEDLLLSDVVLDQASNVLRHASLPPTSSHVKLAEALFEATPLSQEMMRWKREQFLTYVSLLCSTNSSAAALDLVLKWEDSLVSSQPVQASVQDAELSTFDDPIEGQGQILKPGTSAWALVLQGFAKERNEALVKRTFDLIQQRSLPFQATCDVTQEMLRFFATLKDKDGMKRWWTKYRNGILTPDKTSQHFLSDEAHGRNVNAVLTWCVANQELQYGHEIVRDVMNQSPPKPVWDAVLVWAANTGKGPDEIGRMIDVMENASQSSTSPSGSRSADATTINALVQHAISKEDPYSAERFIAVGRERNIEPDATTYVLQMEYRLKVGDVDGALIAYKNLQSLDTTSNDDIPAVNRLIVALCSTKKHDFETIMNVAADLSDRRARFEPTTVSSLALLHLNRGESDDLLDLLNTHSFHYSSAERDGIRDVLLAYILNPKTTTGRAWQAYTIIRRVFDETPREQRTEIMTAFFDRRRPDMGCNIFLNMRQHTREANIPNVETYVAAFMGIAKVHDAESLDVIHNQLKIDFNINSTTKLLNSLMIAHIECDQARYALGLWGDIVDSREGPSYSSLHIALRACEKAPFGDQRAQQLWQLLAARGVEFDNSLWTSYITALAGNGDNEFAISTLEDAFDRGDLQVDTRLLAGLFTAANGSAKQDEIAAWAAEKFPGLWAEVEKMGLEFVSEYSTTRRLKYFDRSLTP